MISVKFFPSKEPSFGYPGRNADCNINGSLLPPLPSSSSFPSLPTDSHRSTFPGTLVVMVALFSTFLLLVSCSVTLVRCCRRRNSTRTLHQQNLPNSDDFFLNQDTINHVWYVNTVGLDESLINSLTILKFKSGEGLVEGTYCSVCLSEFQDGEELRLLPKCNHAFHIQCIDRWLRGHVSCPLCRAPIVANSVAGVDPLPVDDNGALLSDTIESNVTSELSIHDEDNNLESSVDELYELDIEHGKRNRAFDASCANFRESKSELQDKAVPEESSAEFHVRRPVSRSFLIRERVCKGSESDPECDFFPVQRGSTLCSGSSYSEKANLDELPWFNGVSVDSGHNSCELKVVGDARKELYVHKKRSSEMKRSLSMSGDTSSFFFPKHRRNKSSILPL